MKLNNNSNNNNSHVPDENTALLYDVAAENSPQSEIYISSGPTESKATTGIFGATFIVINAAMGAGMLNFPDAFRNAGGIISGMFLQLLFLAFVIGGLMVIQFFCHRFKCKTYQETIDTVCGKKVGLVSEIFIALYMFGTSIAMIIILGDQLEKVTDAITGSDHPDAWYISRKFIMSAAATAVIFPTCIPGDIGFLRHTSFIGVCSALFVMVVVVIKYCSHQYTPGPVAHHPKDYATFMSAIPTMFFSYQCLVSAVPVYDSMRKKTTLNWFIVVMISMLTALVCYSLTGILGYLTFGDDVLSDVLESYHANDNLVIAARISTSIAMLTSYPIVAFCGRAAMITMFIRAGFFAEEPAYERTRRCILTSCWFFLSLGLALVGNSIGEAISLVGGLASTFILLFPGLCLIKYCVEATGYRRWTAFSIGFLYSVLGMFLLGEITTEAVYNIVLGNTEN